MKLKKTMKEIVAGISLLIIMVSIASCGTNNLETDAEPSEETEPDIIASFQGTFDMDNIIDSEDDPYKFVIYEFNCDNWDILVGEETTLTFTAWVVSQYANTDKNSPEWPEHVYVIDYPDGNIWGEMHDDGINGDEIADDCIYTLQYTITSNDTNYNPKCIAVADNLKSDSKIQITTYRHYTEEDYDLAEEVSAEIWDALSPYTTEDGQIIESKYSKAREILKEELEKLLGEGKISSYNFSDESTCATVYVNDDFPFIIDLWIEGYM